MYIHLLHIWMHTTARAQVLTFNILGGGGGEKKALKIFNGEKII